MRPFRHMAVFLLFVACPLTVPLRSNGQSADLPDPTPMGNIGAGSSVVTNVDVILPANEGTIYVQNGAFMAWLDVDKKAPSCRLYTIGSPTVRKLVPGRKLIVTGTRFNNGGPNMYGDVLLFEDDTTINQIQCNSGRKGYMTIGELKKVFGGLFSLLQAEPVVG
jgi:hypothetical protein